MDTYRVGYLVGSLARNSINRKLSRALARLAPSGLRLTEVPSADLPHYSYDHDAAGPPAAAIAYIQFEKDLIIDEGEVTNADTAMADTRP
jgi:NAD(P)H-dependent FMN reductase